MNRFGYWQSISFVFVVGILCGASGFYFSIPHQQNLPADIVFPGKNFFNGIGEQLVVVSGSLTGNGVGYKNNTMLISCYKSEMQCHTIEIDQIGVNQIGDVGLPSNLTITEWNPSIISATTGNEFDIWSCVKTTINIDRKSEILEWVQVPINQSQLSCKNFHDNKIYKWTIEDPTWMKNFKTSLENNK